MNFKQVLVTLLLIVSGHAVGNTSLGVPREAPAPKLLAIAPTQEFLKKVQPITSRLSDVQYFAVGDSLIGVAGHNPRAKGKLKNVMMYFDASGDYMITGMIVRWKQLNNISTQAAEQFFPSTSLAKQGMTVDDSLGKRRDELRSEAASQVQDQNRRLEDSNRNAAQLVDKELQAGIPTISSGTGPKIMTVFVDLGCKSCRKAIGELLDYSEGPGKQLVTVKFALIANPADENATNTVDMIYAVESPTRWLREALKGPLRNVPELQKAGATKRETVGQIAERIQLKSLPFFVIGTGSGSLKKSGYSTLGALL